MSISESQGQDCIAVDQEFDQAIDSLVDAIDAPDSVLRPFVELVEGMANQLDETAQEAAQARDRAHEAEARVEELEQELTEHREDSGQDRASTKQRVHQVETDLEEHLSTHEPDPSSDQDTLPESDVTPIERLSQSDDVDEVTDSASVRRAVSLFENITDWGQKTPKGYCLRPKDNPRSLLEAERDESLAWKQYYRAAEALERLSKGAVTFFDSDRHGKMICLHEQSDLFDRVETGVSPLTSSSVEKGTEVSG